MAAIAVNDFFLHDNGFSLCRRRRGYGCSDRNRKNRSNSQSDFLHRILQKYPGVRTGRDFNNRRCEDVPKFPDFYPEPVFINLCSSQCAERKQKARMNRAFLYVAWLKTFGSAEEETARRKAVGFRRALPTRNDALCHTSFAREAARSFGLPCRRGVSVNRRGINRAELRCRLGRIDWRTRRDLPAFRLRRDRMR
jgi:hypothetical protein